MTQSNRWQALDILRGLTIIFMLLNLNPGAWEHQFPWLVHAKWEGGRFIDGVAPVFLFCIGAVIPLSLRRRFEKGESRSGLVKHILIRAGLLVLIGLIINAYPVFDLAHLRIPGVLQRIGLSYGLVSLFVLFTAGDGLKANSRAMFAGCLFILASYFCLLQFVPVPGFGAPRFDPVGSWPSFVDRALWTTDHMFIYWPVDGKIVFDPDGLVSTWPVCANVLFGALVGHLYGQSQKRACLIMAVTGAAMMIVAVLLSGVCPIIKNIWTPTFALFTSGAAVAILGGLTLLVDHFRFGPAFFPATVYGSNALLAYILTFALGPVIDRAWLKAPLYNLRHAGYVTFLQWFPPNLASFCFGLVMVSVIFVPLYICYRKRWFLKL